MRRLKVWLQLEGRDLVCGTIEGRDYEDAVFAYTPAFLEREDACPLSISLPLQKESFSAARTRAWFSALLPDSYAAGTTANRLRIRQEDYLSMLSFLGGDAPGALKILDEEFPPAPPSMEEMAPAEVRALAGADERKLTDLMIRSGTALPGQTPQCCLYQDPAGKRWFLPCQEAAGTHLVRQSLIPYEDTAVNEALCMKTAEKLGIPVCQTILSGDKDSLLTAVRRPDRIMNPAGGIIKRHREDLGQALGIAPSGQYEKNYEGYMASMFRLLRENVQNPMEDMKILWDRIVFNFLAGNMQGHIRSFGLIYAGDLRTMSLSPATGLVSTTVYDSLPRTMPFHIDGYYNPDNISQESFENMASSCGLGRKMAGARFRAMADRFEKALTESAGELDDLGFFTAHSFCSKILQTGGCAKL